MLMLIFHSKLKFIDKIVCKIGERNTSLESNVCTVHVFAHSILAKLRKTTSEDL